MYRLRQGEDRFGFETEVDHKLIKLVKTISANLFNAPKRAFVLA